MVVLTKENYKKYPIIVFDDGSWCAFPSEGNTYKGDPFNLDKFIKQFNARLSELSGWLPIGKYRCLRIHKVSGEKFKYSGEPETEAQILYKLKKQGYAIDHAFVQKYITPICKKLVTSVVAPATAPKATAASSSAPAPSKSDIEKALDILWKAVGGAVPSATLKGILGVGADDDDSEEEYEEEDE